MLFSPDELIAAVTNKSVLNGLNSHISVIDGSLQFHRTAEGLLRALPSAGPFSVTGALKASAQQPDHSCKISACASPPRTEQAFTEKKKNCNADAPSSLAKIVCLSAG